MKKTLLWLLCFALLTTMVGCGGEEAQLEEETPWYAEEEDGQEEAPSGEAALLPDRFALAIHRSQTLDGVECSEGTQQYVGSLLYEPLFALNSELEPEKVLCEDYTVSEDGKVWLLRLRQDALFADGSALDAKDVVATLRRALISARYATRLADIASVSATRDGSVQITLWQPNSRLPALLDVPVVKAGTERELVPTGTGPYLFITDGDGAYLRARSDWWQKKDVPLERIELVDAKDAATVQYLFTSREVQLYAAHLTGATSALVGSLDCVDVPTTTLHYIGFNMTNTLLADAAVRRCISAGIDRNTVTTGFLSGHARPTEFPIAPESALYPAGLERGYSYEAFFAAAESVGGISGVERPLRLLVNAESDEKETIAAYIAQSLEKANLTIMVETLPWQEYLTALSAGDFDLYYAEVKLSADWDAAPMLATGGALNYGGWSNLQTDELLAACRAAQDGEGAFAALYAHLAEEMPIVPICFENLSVLTHRGTVSGMTPTAGDLFRDFGNWTIRLAQ